MKKKCLEVALAEVAAETARLAASQFTKCDNQKTSIRMALVLNYIDVLEIIKPTLYAPYASLNNVV